MGRGAWAQVASYMPVACAIKASMPAHSEQVVGLGFRVLGFRVGLAACTTSAATTANTKSRHTRLRRGCGNDTRENTAVM